MKTFKKLLGIDESNHGKYPEIFVGVYSENLEDLLETEGLGKIRRNSKLKDALTKNQDFRYVVIPKEYAKILGKKNIPKVACAELIKSFNGIDSIIIDGEFPKIFKTDIRRIAYPVKARNIKTIPRADITYPLVNSADHIANLLHRHYSHGKNIGNNDFIEKIITLKVEDYLPLIKK